MRKNLSAAITRCVLDTLEQRQLFSVFYNYEIVAQSGAGGLTGMGTGPSINDNGTVAYIGKHTVGDAIIVKPQGGVSKNVSPGVDNTSSRTFSQTVQINNSGKAAVQARVIGATLRSFIQLYDTSSTDSYTTAATADSGGTGQYQAVFPFPSTNNSSTTAFGAFTKSLQRVLATNGGSTFGMLGIAQPMVADNGNVIVKGGATASSPINLFSSALGLIKSFTDSSFTTTGAAPGISDDGKAIAFAAIGPAGPAIYASFLNGTTWTTPQIVAGGNKTTTSPELGFDDAGNNVYFKDFSLDSRVAIIHKDLGATGLAGDLVEVSFIGTPSAKSITNPQTNSPLLFTANQGLWTERIEMDTQFVAPRGFVAHPMSAQPVVQIGDKILGQTITGLSVFDQLALAATDDTGKARTVRPGDHRVVFYATTSAGSVIMRAGHLDSDEDGLMDHWETKGVDINNDGTSDLNLAAMGANPLKRDLFVEMDWTNPRTTGVPASYSNEPTPGMVHQLDVIYKNAPALTDGVPAGITIHVDAGSGKDKNGNPFSVNMGTGSLQGGSLIAMPNGAHPDVVYVGMPGKYNIPGLNTLSMTEAKKKYFGGDSKFARELVFHYNVLADFQDVETNASKTPITGVIKAGSLTDAFNAEFVGQLPGQYDEVLITSGKGAGQMRQISDVRVTNATNQYFMKLTNPWTIIPDSTSKYVILQGYTGLAEVGFYKTPDNNSIPGNDYVVSMGTQGEVPSAIGVLSNTYDQYRTDAHELGHTLGLRHGGTDHNAYKGGSYNSLMSYSHQLTPSDTVVSYSNSSDVVFNDWENIKMNFQDSFTHIGNAFGKQVNGAGDLVGLEDSAESILKHIGQTPDYTGPKVTFTSPVASSTVKLNTAPVIKLTATDLHGVSAVSVLIDLNGNGKTTDAGETITAVASAGGVYTATFTGKWTGALGNRTITVLASDSLGNYSLTSQIVKLIA